MYTYASAKQPYVYYEPDLRENHYVAEVHAGGDAGEHLNLNVEFPYDPNTATESFEKTFQGIILESLKQAGAVVTPGQLLMPGCHLGSTTV